ARQRRKSDAGPRARRLIHLAVDERRFGEDWLAGLELRLLHFMPQVVAFASSLTDTSKTGIAAVLLGDVIDELLNKHRFTDTGAAEKADLSTATVGCEKVDNFDAGLKHFDFDRLIDKLGRCPVNRQKFFGIDRAALVNWITDHVQDPAEYF